MSPGRDGVRMEHRGQGLDTERVAGDLAGGRVVEADEGAQVAEVLRGVLGGDGLDREVETAADHRGDVANGDALLGHGVQT